ncbi:MAG: ABC transporter substrate-binding protein, partial [Pseudolabrys sp.]
MKLTRRTVIHSAASVALAPALDILRPFGAAAQTASTGGAPEWRHALSLFNEVRYPPDFKHFDYVNPQAPKGGTARMIAFGTFDNFNRVVAGVKGSFAQGAVLISESLTTGSLDEVSTEYGQLAEAVRFPADYSTVTYRLRAAARWHDGKPVTAEDVIYSLDVMKKNSPFFGAYYRHVTKAEETGEREVTFTFDQPGNRELPQIV